MNPINTIKHVIDSQDTIGAGTEINRTLVSSVENAVSTSVTEVDQGSYVRSFFINVQVLNSTNAVGNINNVYMYLFGNAGNELPLTAFPAVNGVGSSNLRKNVFHQEMAMLSDANDSIPITLFKGVIRIPKKFQRMGVGDTISIRIGSPVGGPEIDACVQTIYKEIR